VARVAVDAGVLSDDFVFANAAFSTRQLFGQWRLEEALRVDVDDQHHRGVLAGSLRSGSFRLGARYQRDGGAEVVLGGLPSSILPRSAYALRVLDPALPPGTLRGDEYQGWRVDTTVPAIPFTAFYQRHELGPAQLSLTGLEIALSSGPNPILKLPAFDLTLGAARILDEPDRGDTNWWLGMRWRP
jgi:hypothetical protein